jgi:type I restriction enzyme M protein
MTLQDAIEKVIKEFRKPMKASEIALEINHRNLYVKADKTKVTGSQISARVNKYPELFKIDEQGISLHDIALIPYRDFTSRMTNTLRRIAPVDNDNRVRDLVASFLILIYYQKHVIFLNEKSGRCKEALKIAFENFAFKEPSVKDNFSQVLDFLSRAISEFEAEQILRVIGDYQFNLQPAPSQEEFSSFFNDVVNAYSWKSNFRGGEFSTPKLITKLMCSFYELREGSTVFDPFAGRASLLSELLQEQKNYIREILAGDINPNSVNVGSLNIFATGFRHFEYKQRNAFTEWKGKLEADLVISNPPFGGKVENFDYDYNWQIPSTDISINAIQLALHHVNNDGKVILVLPESILFNTSNAHKHIRQMLVGEDLLHGVILLPKNSFKPYASVSSVLLLLDKSRPSKSTGIFFYDASNISASEFSNEITAITSAFHSETSIREKVRWVNSEEIITHDYDLTVKKYLLQTLSGEGFVPLKELTDGHFVGNHVSADNINKIEGIPYIQVGDLVEGEGLETFKINYIKSFVSDSELISSTIKEIPTGSILLAKVGTKLKPTLFEGNFHAIASSNIIILKPAHGVLAEYLVSQLQSDYVIKQIDVIRRYNAIPNFNLKDLLNIKIKRLSLEQQHQYVSTYYSRKIADIERSETKSKDDDLYNLISRIKHEVKQPVSSIGIDIDVLSGYLKEKEEKSEPVSLDDYAVAPLEGQSADDIERTKVSNILVRIRTSVDEAQETLQKAEETLNIGKGALKVELVEVRKFIESSIKPLYSNRNCTIELHGKEQIINADKYQLKILFKHIIENALKYGFTAERHKEQNIIRIELKRESTRSFLEIVVMNNGKPFSKGFNKALFETKGVTTDRNNGSGFGGYHIKKIIENHKGEFQIADDEEVQFTDFKVKFKIYFPLNL